MHDRLGDLAGGAHLELGEGWSVDARERQRPERSIVDRDDPEDT